MVMVGLVWKSKKVDDRQVLNTNGSNLDLLEIFQKVCTTHQKYLEEYETKLGLIKQIYKIFRSFFVFQWIVHLFGLFFHISHLIRPWITRGQIIDAGMLIETQRIYEGLYIVFDGLALVITHVCALKMNSYLRRYIRNVQEKQLKAVKDQPLQYSITHSLFLIKSENFAKSNFTPCIPGTGLSISLNIPGFMLSIIISVFALIGSLIAF